MSEEHDQINMHVIEISSKVRRKSIAELTPLIGEKAAVRAESGIYDITNDKCRSNSSNLPIQDALYNDYLMNVVYGLTSDNPTRDKIKQVIRKDYKKAYLLADYRPEEWDESSWERIIRRRNATEDRLKNLPAIEWHPCKICKNKMHRHVQLQTRSLDEATTSFYICTECGKTTRINR
jgi:DNA-directed RNA polymerase subunit M/transcription elongation factor TFIIS